MSLPVEKQFDANTGVATLSLNLPDKRNAMTLDMFDGLDTAIAAIAKNADCLAVILQGRSKVFCAGFDLAAAVEEPQLMGEYIERLSRVIRELRRLPQPVVAAVQGAAIAGGCAVLSGCDFVVTDINAKFGYPVHRIGVSPAVTLPTLMPMIGGGAARALVVSGRLIDGREAKRIGLATHVVEVASDDGSNESGVADIANTVHQRAQKFAEQLAAKPPHALQRTKRWLNELDGSLDDERFDLPVQGSLELVGEQEAVDMLRKAWGDR